MQRTRSRDTSSELARSAVHCAGLRFRVDWRIPQTRRRADLAFVVDRVLVFSDGCFWHGCPTHYAPPKRNRAYWRAKVRNNVQRDRDTDATLAALGWTVLR